MATATRLLASPDRAVNDGFGILAVNRMGTTAFVKQNPRIHVVHAGADAPAVDLFAGPAGGKWGGWQEFVFINWLCGARGPAFFCVSSHAHPPA